MSVSPRFDVSVGAHGLRRKAVVEDLLREVVQGDLRPGQHLVTQALADRFAVSHTPIREALIALAGIGVVDLLPNRGAVVRRFLPGEVEEICKVRCILECEAVRGACGRVDPAELRALREALQGMIARTSPYSIVLVAEARSADSRLHDLIASRSGNGFLAKEIGRLKILFRAFRDAAWKLEQDRNSYHRLAEEAREHLAIVEALIANDREAADRAMSDHIRSGCDYWCRSLPRAPAGSLTDRQDSRDAGEGNSR